MLGHGVNITGCVHAGERKEFNPFRVTRHFFKYDLEKNKKSVMEKRIPDDFEIKLTDLNDNFEFIIKKGSETVCKCSSVFIGDGKVEISVETDERYRRQGYARFISNVFIERCLEKGLAPNWSCWDYNNPSFQLALKLGFENHQNLQAHIIKQI